MEVIARIAFQMASPVLFVLGICTTANAQEVRLEKYADIEVDNPKRIGTLIFSPDGQELSYMINGTSIETWDVLKKQRGRTHPAIVRYSDFAYAPDGKSIIASEVSKLYHINMSTGKSNLIYTQDKEISRIIFTDKGDRLVIGDAAGGLTTLDVAQNRVTSKDRLNGAIYDLVAIPNTDKLFISHTVVEKVPNKPNTTSISFRISQYDLSNKAVKTVVDDPGTGYERCLAVTPDGKHLAIPGASTVSVLSSSTFVAEHVKNCPMTPFICRFATDQLLIVGGGQKGVLDVLMPPGEVAIYNRNSFKWTYHMGVMDDTIKYVSYSHKSNYVAFSSGKSNTASVWKLSNTDKQK